MTQTFWQRNVARPSDQISQGLTERKPRRVRTAVAAAACLSLLLAGCASTSNAAPEASGDTNSTCVSGAEEILKTAENVGTLAVEPADVDPSDASGKSVWLIYPAAGTFWESVVSGLEEGAAAAGMDVHAVNANGSLPGLSAAFSQALAADADGIIVGAFAPAAYANQLVEAKNAGIPVTSAMEATPGSTHADGVTQLVGVDFPKNGEILAAEMLAATSCDLNSLVLYPNGSLQLEAGEKSIESTVADLCGSTCKVAGADFPQAQFATAVGPLAVTRFNADPNINFMVSTASAFGPLIESSLTQGQIDIPLTGQGAQPEDLKAIAAGGLMKSNLLYPPGNFVGWTLADSFVRVFADEKQEDVVLPGRLVTTESLSRDGTELSDVWPGYADYATSFKAAWGVK